MNRHQYSLRDFLWLSIILALAFAWWRDRTAIKRELAKEHNLVDQSMALIMDLEARGWKIDLRADGVRIEEPPTK